MPELAIRAALEEDAPLILRLIKELAEYEKLSHEVVATGEGLAARSSGSGASRRP